MDSLKEDNRRVITKKGNEGLWFKQEDYEAELVFKDKDDEKVLLSVEKDKPYQLVALGHEIMADEGCEYVSVGGKVGTSNTVYGNHMGDWIITPKTKFYTSIFTLSGIQTVYIDNFYHTEQYDRTVMDSEGSKSVSFTDLTEKTGQSLHGKALKLLDGGVSAHLNKSSSKDADFAISFPLLLTNSIAETSTIQYSAQGAILVALTKEGSYMAANLTVKPNPVWVRLRTKEDLDGYVKAVIANEEGISTEGIKYRSTYLYSTDNYTPLLCSVLQSALEELQKLS